MLLIFFILIFSPFFGKIEILTFFSKIYFLIKISEILSKYCIYECLQIKNKKNRDKCHRKRSKKLLNLLRVLRRKITLVPPHMLPDTFFSVRHRFLGSLG